MKRDVDYTLYMVTDRDLMNTASVESAVESAIRGGCTLVQLREKKASSLEFYQIAKSVKRVTDRYNIPLIINDRVDIALAVDADGVHVGQSDLPAAEARELIGQDKILGVSASCLDEALTAVRDGADYIGVGAMFATGTKADACITSMEALRLIRGAVSLPIVVIGGINIETAVLFRGGWIDGLAVVSAILSKPDIEAATKELKKAFLQRDESEKIEAVIFDMDGTLIDSLGIWKKIDVDFLARRGYDVPQDYTAAVSARSFCEAAAYTIERFGLCETIDSVMEEWHEMAAYEYGHHIKLKPYAKEYLQSLKDRKIKLGVATSLTESLLQPVLKHNGVDELFDVVCSTDEVKRGKEFPDIFVYTAQRLKTRPENCLVFEDLPQAILSAKRAGMRVYGVFDEYSKDNWEKIKRIADGVVCDFQNTPLLD